MRPDICLYRPRIVVPLLAALLVLNLAVAEDLQLRMPARADMPSRRLDRRDLVISAALFLGAALFNHYVMTLSTGLMESYHGRFHAAYIYHIFNGIIPPTNVHAAGEPANFYWPWHLMIAGVMTGTKMAPFEVNALVGCRLENLEEGPPPDDDRPRRDLHLGIRLRQLGQPMRATSPQLRLELGHARRAERERIQRLGQDVGEDQLRAERLRQAPSVAKRRQGVIREVRGDQDLANVRHRVRTTQGART